jgi:hypothetical protein
MSKIIGIEEGKRIRQERKRRESKKERTFNEVVAHAMDEHGVLDLSALDNLPPVGYNGGVKCDVTEGPCSCGAWHHRED